MAGSELAEDWWQESELDLIMELPDWSAGCLVLMTARF